MYVICTYKYTDTYAIFYNTLSFLVYNILKIGFKTINAMY
jgi:hypothetical protein